jgi:hypothetical protein
MFPVKVFKMQLKVYAVGCCLNEGYVTQLAGCGILLAAIDKIDGVYANCSSKKIRRFSYGLGDSGQDLADLQAVRLALASIGPDFRKYPTEIFVNNQIVFDVTAAKTPEVFNDKLHQLLLVQNVIKDLRKWIGFYDDAAVKLSGFTSDDKKYMEEAMSLAENAAALQKQSDSGTDKI